MPYIATRAELEQEERKRLAPYATYNAKAGGREFVEPKDDFRLDFQRDKDRVLHSKSFRRLKGKTQVFVAHYGDHFRSRLTHSLEVAQLARALARTLRANEDLAECIALAHDLGHTPFGHAGEEAMNELLHRYGHDFEHNAQSRRIVEKLERKSADFPGLNLTLETREGLWKHRTPYDKKHHALSEQGSLEAQIVDLADEIAFQNHDIEDGLASGIIDLAELEKLALWRKAGEKVTPTLSEIYRIPYAITSLIKIMFADAVNETARRLDALQAKSAADIKNAPEKTVAFSPEIAENNHHLRHFLISRFYKDKIVADQCERGKEIIKKLFFYYQKQPAELPENFRGEEAAEIRIKDFIAGMTDNFALERAEMLEKKHQ